MKESFAKITAWIKAHPIPAAIIGLVVVVVGYFVVKSSGGNSSGESIDGGALGNEEAGGIVGIGGGSGDASTDTTPPPGIIPPPASEITPPPAGRDISANGAAESIANYGTPSSYVNESSIFASPVTAEEIINKKTLAESGFQRSLSAGVDTGNKSDGTKLKSTNTGQPARPLTRLGIGSAISRLTSPLKAPSLASIQRVTTTPSPAAKLNAALSSALVKTPPAKPGYKWDSQLRKYVKLTSTSTVKKAKAR